MKKLITLNIDEEVLSRVKEVAKAHDASIQRVLRLSIKEGLDVLMEKEYF